MAEHPAGSVTHHGIEVPIFVDDRGRWHADLGSTHVMKYTRDHLSEEIKKLTRRQRVTVSVPFVELCYIGSTRDQIMLRRGTATGLHSSNGNVLVTWSNGTREQHRGYAGYDVYEDLSPKQAKDLEWLFRAKIEADRALAAFNKAHKVHLKDVVTEAMDSAKD
jgi:hypothetical protein